MDKKSHCIRGESAVQFSEVIESLLLNWSGSRNTRGGLFVWETSALCLCLAWTWDFPLAESLQSWVESDSASTLLQSTTTDDRKKSWEGRGRRNRDMYTITEVGIWVK